MKKEKVIRKGSRNPMSRRISMTIRVNEAESKFMKDNKFSPQLIFLEALKDLGFKE